MKTVTYILALVLTLIIAYFAYDNLSKNMQIDRLSDPSGIIGTEENTRISKMKRKPRRFRKLLKTKRKQRKNRLPSRKPSKKRLMRK